MRRIYFWTIIITALFLVSFQDRLKKEEVDKFRTLMKEYQRHYSPLKLLSDKVKDKCCYVEYTVKVKKVSFGGVSREDFGGSEVVEVKKYLLGTILNELGLVLIDGSIFEDATLSAGSNSFKMSYSAFNLSRPYNFRIQLPRSKREFTASLVGVNTDINVGFLRINLNDGERIGYLDISDESLKGSDLSEIQEHDNFIFMQLVYLKNPPSSFEDLALTMGSRFFVGYKRLGNKDYAVMQMYVPYSVPVFDEINQKLLGFSTNVSEGIQRQIPNEGIVDQGGFFNIQGFRQFSNTGNIIVAGEIKELLSNEGSIATLEKNWTGITEFQEINHDAAGLIGLISEGQQPHGILAVEVVEDSPAFNAGLRSGDIITHWADEEVTASDKEQVYVFNDLVESFIPGNQIEVTYRRFTDNGISSPVTISFRIEDPLASILEAKTYLNETFGAMFTEITMDRVIASAYYYQYHLGKVIVKNSTEGSWFEMGGLHPSDIIYKVNGADINSIEDIKEAFEQLEKSQPKEVVLIVEKALETRFVKLTPDWSRSQ